MDQKPRHGQDVFEKGHHTQGEQSLASNPISRGVSFVIRKTEKLTTALYMVTDIMAEKDPMKWKVREIAVDILSDITVAGSASPAERMSIFRNVMRKIERVVSFLDIAQSAQVMSEMNASVLRKEYLALRDAIEAEWHHVYDDGKRLLAGAFSEAKHREEVKSPEPVVVAPVKEVPAPRPVTQAPEVKAPMVQIEPIVTSKDQPVEAPAEKPVAEQAAMRELPRLHLERLRIPVPTPRPAAPQAPVQQAPILERPRVAEVRDDSSFGRARTEGDRDDRRKIILALIKQKPSLTVKDIAKSIPQVSEKTIQRELLAMVAEGQLVKKGERRWSTYSLREG